jgi:hypothetical protein
VAWLTLPVVCKTLPQKEFLDIGGPILADLIVEPQL